MTYQQFLENKIVTSVDSGFLPESVHDVLFPHQKDIVNWACLGGKRAIFAAFGLGKSLIQLEILRQNVAKFNKPVLVICPLGVKQEFQRDARLIGVEKLEYIKADRDFDLDENKFFITNYERVRDGNIDVNKFHAVTLDEASVLRSYGSKTYQTFLDKFRDVPFRYVATATPSPNKYKELIHYAGFLGVMDTGQALTRFFQRDSTKANNLTIYPHKEKEFWMWMSSWSVFINQPSDLGYSDDGYDLPDLKIHWHLIPDDHSEAGADSWGNIKMFKDKAASLSDASREKRNSIEKRLQLTKSIIDSKPESHFILWHHLEAERKAIESLKLDSYHSIYGTQDIDKREKLIIDFYEGNYRILGTKPEICGSGCNFQHHCSDMIFMGVDYKFNDTIQAVHRCYRFMQKKEVNVHFIYTEAEENIVKSIQEKWKRHNELQKNMTEIIKQYGLNKDKAMSELKRSIGVNRQVVKGDLFECIHNDCVEETSKMEENSVDLIHTSIPFNNHYEYTPSYNDFGHTDDVPHFMEQMDFLTPELFRVLKPGRIAAIHVKNRVRFGNVTGLGFPTIEPFSHECVRHYISHGFKFMGEIIVLTDVVRENNQTYRLGWTEMTKDGTKMGVGCPEYILLFRKPQTDQSNGFADIPVSRSKEESTRKQWQIDAHAFWRSNGNRLYKPEELAELDIEKIGKLWKKYNKSHVYDYDEHVSAGEVLEKQGRLPATFMLFPPHSWSDWIWDDVTRMHTLNSEQSRRNLQNHICPLQFDIVDRIIERFSNKGELVYDPFGGLMTVPFRSIKLGRRGKACELNPDYFKDGVEYCKAAEYEMSIPTLFDMIAV